MTDDDKPQWLVTRQSVSEAFAEGVPLVFINATTLSFLGRATEITDGQAIPDGAFLVCAPPSPHTARGSVLGACDDCARPIVYMATAPPQLKRVCWRCAKRMGAFL